MHAPTKGNAPLNSIALQVIEGADVLDNDAGFFVSQRLSDRMNFNPDTAKYTLVVVPRYGRSSGGLTSEAVDTRYNITVSTTWKLIEVQTGEVVYKNTSSSTSSFGATRGPYGVVTANGIGLQQASSGTADRIIVQLAGYFARNPER